MAAKLKTDGVSPLTAVLPGRGCPVDCRIRCTTPAIAISPFPKVAGSPPGVPAAFCPVRRSSEAGSMFGLPGARAFRTVRVLHEVGL
jgi:hypothetical protein